MVGAAVVEVVVVVGAAVVDVVEVEVEVEVEVVVVVVGAAVVGGGIVNASAAIREMRSSKLTVGRGAVVGVSEPGTDDDVDSGGWVVVVGLVVVVFVACASSSADPSTVSTAPATSVCGA